MSFSFPHLVWIFQKAFSAWATLKLWFDWWLMLSLLVFSLWVFLMYIDFVYGELHCEKFYPSFCFFHIVIPNWDIIIWHIWNNEVRCWGYVTHGGWWYLVIQLSLWHILPYILQPLRNLDTVPLSCHYSWSKSTSTHTQEGGIITTVFIIFLHIEIASQSLHTHSHILLLDISLLYCFTLHTLNDSAYLTSK